MSRRSGTRTSTPPRAKAPAKKRKDAGAAKANGGAQVGTRAFTRRARALKRTGATTQRRPGSRTSLPERAAMLASLPFGAILRRIPRAAWICALVACLNAVCWSILTPPFEAPDEPDHFAYVKQLAETGSLPSQSERISSEEELATLVEIHYFDVRQQPQHHTIASHTEQAALESQLASIPHDKGSASAGVATSQPPLYYALESIPYTLASNGTVLDRLALMRLLSALFAGLTALFAFLFVREALPATPWAWTVGGLSVALTPLLGFMSGVVNPDAMLFAVSAATFYALARAFRRGLDTRGAVAIGVLIATGLLTKLNYVGLIPGVLVGLAVLGAYAARTDGRRAYRLPALAVGIGFSPVLLYAAANLVSNHSLLGLVSRTINTTHGSKLAELDYIWQFYLPRLPATASYFPGLFTPRLWFDDFVGLYGYLDTTFPGWVDTLALIPAGAIALLCGRSLLADRASLRSRWSQVVVYAVMGAGLMVLVAADSYRRFPLIDAEFAQPRYMLPLLALLGVATALAARGAGRRWGPVVGTLIVVVFLAHDVLSQMLVAGRFYA